MLWLVVFWLALAFIVGLIANMRGRDGIGWFALAILISPFLAGLLVLVFARKPSPLEQAPATSSKRRPMLSTFKPDGVYAGIAYMVTPDSAIVAATPEGLIRFRTIEDFLAAVKERAAA